MGFHHHKLLFVGVCPSAGRVQSPSQGSSCLAAWVSCSLGRETAWPAPAPSHPLMCAAGRPFGSRLPGDAPGCNRGERQHLLFPFSPCLTSSGWLGRASQATLIPLGPGLPAPAQPLPSCCAAGFSEKKCWASAVACPFLFLSSHTGGGKVAFYLGEAFTTHPCAPLNKKAQRYPFMRNF